MLIHPASTRARMFAIAGLLAAAALLFFKGELLAATAVGNGRQPIRAFSHVPAVSSEIDERMVSVPPEERTVGSAGKVRNDFKIVAIDPCASGSPTESACE